MIGFDYTDRIAPAALKAAGAAVVSRYLSQPGWPKNLTTSEAAEIRAAGIPILLNYETTADFMLGGYAAGVTCARSARQQATALGAPNNARIYYSADFDASPSQTSIVIAFLNGAASVDGASNVGVYGGLRVVQAAASVGYATWQTIAWSGGQWDSRALMRQTGTEQNVAGVQVDVNQVMNLGALGTWGTTTPTPNTGEPMGTYQVSAGWQNDYPDVADALRAHIPAGTVVDETQAAAYSMIRSFVTAERTAAIEAKLDQLLNRPAAGPGVDINALEAAIVAGLLPHLTGNVDVPALAAALAPAVVAHLGLQVVAK